MVADEWIKKSFEKQKAISISTRKEFSGVKKMMILNSAVIAGGFIAVLVSMYFAFKMIR